MKTKFVGLTFCMLLSALGHAQLTVCDCKSQKFKVEIGVEPSSLVVQDYKTYTVKTGYYVELKSDTIYAYSVSWKNGTILQSISVYKLSIEDFALGAYTKTITNKNGDVISEEVVKRKGTVTEPKFDEKSNAYWVCFNVGTNANKAIRFTVSGCEYDIKLPYRQEGSTSVCGYFKDEAHASNFKESLIKICKERYWKD